MGRLKQIQIEKEEERRLAERDHKECERALDFDTDNHQESDWWREQDTEMLQAETDQINMLADEQNERMGGWR